MEKYHSSVTVIALVPAALALIHCNRLVIFLGINVIRYIYLITSILRNIASQLQCISASAAGTSAIPVTDEQYFSVAM